MPLCFFRHSGVRGERDVQEDAGQVLGVEHQPHLSPLRRFVDVG